MGNRKRGCTREFAVRFFWPRRRMCVSIVGDTENINEESGRC